MKKTKLTRSLLAACSIVALSAVVYGCDSGPSQSEYDEVKAEADANAEAAAAAAAAQAQAEAAAAAAAAAQAEAEAATAAAAAAQAEAEAKAAADVAAAEAAAMAAAAAQAAAEAAAAAQAEADAAALQAAVDAAAAAAEQAAMAATQAAEAKAAAEQAAADLAAAETARMEAEAAAEAAKMAQEEAEERARMAEEGEEEASDELTEAEAEEKAAMLGALYRGLLTASIDRSEPADDDFVDPGDYLALNGDPTIVASSGMLSTIIAPVPPANGSNAAFATGTTTDAGDLGDWSGTDMMAPNPPADFTDHLVVYTDVNVGTELTFNMLFPNASAAEIADDATTATAKTNLYDEANRIVTVAALNMHQGLMMGDEDNEFQTGSGMKRHGTPGLDEETIEFTGTFAGATGTYRCVEASGGDGDCTSSGTNLGTMLSTGVDRAGTMSGVWSFNPDAGVMASVPDSNYNYFGWWLRMHGTGFYDADAFHGSTENPAAVANTLTGTATYVGQAAGKVAINPQLPGRALIGGAFTADAMLTANFEADLDNDGDSADEAGSLSGMIDNFMVDGEEVDWTVSLGSSAITPADPAIDHDDNADTDPIAQGQVTIVAPLADDSNAAASAASGWGKVGWTIDDAGSTTVGSWSANFWAPGLDGVPGSVTGEFTASYNDQVGRMEGAFGANKE